MMFSDIPVRSLWGFYLRFRHLQFWTEVGSCHLLRAPCIHVSSHFRGLCQDEDGNSDDDDADVHLVHLRSQEEIRRTLAWSHELDLHLELWQIRMMMMMMRIVSPGTIRMMILMRTLRKTRISFLSFWKASPCQMLMILVGTALILGRNGLTEDISQFW